MPDNFASLQAVLVDRYRFERELGRGGMATVYLARDLKHKRLVAIKLLRPELANTLGPERFLREFSSPPACSTRTLPLLGSGTLELGAAVALNQYREFLRLYGRPVMGVRPQVEEAKAGVLRLTRRAG